MDSYKKIDFIRKCAKYEGTELGPIWKTLCDLYDDKIYFSEKFNRAIIDEVDEVYNYLKENSKLVEHEITTTFKQLELVFLDEE